MKKLQHLPIGDSSFESIRQDNKLYVDKTRYLYQLVDQGKYYFLSRPRRFGKSLTVSTLRCMFQGQKELFEGLWIAENSDWEWKSHPVILLDFNEISHDTPEALKQGLESSLRNTGQSHDIQLKESLLKEQFKELVVSLNQKNRMPVVILIDEYDKPIIDYLGKGASALEIAKSNRDILKYFFGVIKGADVARVLRFVFITGVSKFSRVSIFSDLNNLDDITMNRHYAEMLGYTQNELETNFAQHIEMFASEVGETPEQVIENLRIYYNGYRFSEKDVRVYNPFSVLKSLNEHAYKNYWFETGTPTFLVNLLHEKNWYLPSIENMRATEALFSVYEIERLQPEALLFQTGYVTIKAIRGKHYIFDYPNQEVKTAFLETLLYSYTESIRDRTRFVLLAEYLFSEDIHAFMETMMAIYKDIANTLTAKRDEAYFHTLFYLMVSASGGMVHSEVLTCDGRIDLVVEFHDKVYLIEFKCNQSADVALQQIKDKQYDLKYHQTGKKIIRIGINFETEKKNIGEWKVERD